jgi:riboflavin kinase/FMN adenylyltransferase
VKIFRTLPVALSQRQPIALAIGHFDGVHLGHQAMLKRVGEAARDLNLIPSVLTFEPSPREFFSKSDAPAKLYPLRMRLSKIADLGIERAYVLRFDERLARMETPLFADELLTQTLNTRWLLLSDEARFGLDRRGSLEFLRGRNNAFLVERMAMIEVEGARISSTRVRHALSQSDFGMAARLLGGAYRISGRVVRGDALGRTIGFPTANLPIHEKSVLFGVFAVKVFGLGDPLNGVASLGMRPTVKGKNAPPLLEAHLFDFNEDIYGRHIEVEFVAKIRDEQRFPDLAALTRQIERDALTARRVLGVA